MTAMPPPPPTAAGLPTLDVSATPRTPFARLVKVELRKMFDTRGGFWLMLITAGLLALTAALVLLVVALSDGVVLTADGLSQVFTLPVSVLMPVFGILTVTSEWSQRSALTSFTLEPHRARVMAAKWVAVSALALLTIVVAVVFGAMTNAAGAAIGNVETQWNLALSSLGWTVLVQLLYFWMAFGIAMVFLNTPAAIAVFYVVALLLPLMVWSILFAVFGWAEDVIPWIDLQYASTPVIMGENFDGDPIGPLAYVRFAFAIFLWIVVPFAVGGGRIHRAEVK